MIARTVVSQTWRGTAPVSRPYTPDHPVRAIRRVPEHQRTATGNHAHTEFVSGRDGGGEEAAAAEGAVQPDLLDAQRRRLAHRRLGRRRGGRDDDGVDPLRDRGEARVARNALDLIGSRVHRDDSEAPLAQSGEDGVPAVPGGRSGDPGDGDPLGAEELGGSVLHGHHDALPSLVGQVIPLGGHCPDSVMWVCGGGPNVMRTSGTAMTQR